MKPCEGSKWGLNKPKFVAILLEEGIDMTDVSRRCLTNIELQMSSQQNLHAFQ